MALGDTGTRCLLTRGKKWMRGKRIKKPNNISKPSRRPFVSVVGRKRSHWTTYRLSRTASARTDALPLKDSAARVEQQRRSIAGIEEQQADRVAALKE